MDWYSGECVGSQSSLHDTMTNYSSLQEEEDMEQKELNNSSPSSLSSTFGSFILLFHDSLRNFLNRQSIIVSKPHFIEKKIIQNRQWAIEFTRSGGLNALLGYINRTTAKRLTLIDVILLNEALQCLRKLMNIIEIFEHIANNNQYINGIVKTLTIPSPEIRMRVFELLTALCVYSHEGYDLVLKALRDFEVNFFDYIEKLTKNTRFYDTLLDYAELLIDIGHENDNDDDESNDTEEFDNRETGISDDKLRWIENPKKRTSANQSEQYSNVFAVITEQLKYTEVAKHKWSALALINNILSCTDFIDKRLHYRNILLADGFLSTLERARRYDDIDLNFQIDIFLEKKQYGEEEYLKQFDQNDLLAIGRAIEFQLRTDSNEKAMYLTAMQLLHATFTSCTIRTQTDIPFNSVVKTNNIINNFEKDILSSSLDTSIISSPPNAPPLPESLAGNNSVSPALPLKKTATITSEQQVFALPSSSTVPEAPSLKSDISCSPSVLSTNVTTGSVLEQQRIYSSGISKLLDSIPRPEGKVRRLPWKKLQQTILSKSNFWSDINDCDDVKIDFKLIEKYFEIDDSNDSKQNDKTDKIVSSHIQILPCTRSINIDVFLKKFNIDFDEIVQAICCYDTKSTNVECLRMLSKILPTSEEITLVNNHMCDQWSTAEHFIHSISKIQHYEFRIQTQLLIVDFKEFISDYREKFQQLLDTMDYLKHNLSIKEFIRLLLAIGNFLNYVHI
ncbi:unnamed protein product [Didymodactylos carnosus]|uniref:GBD/FH3 domain-containing protein n=1 Tax=Didymodactylos carnosus TaxID=1234261 RepID=A0A814V4T6_9BILA|nr:unnamed protein product [Didymodactylos carnosus]CAF3948598.1 unnamed protein product [Didymodactylos carnosus]